MPQNISYAMRVAYQLAIFPLKTVSIKRLCRILLKTVLGIKEPV